MMPSLTFSKMSKGPTYLCLKNAFMGEDTDIFILKLLRVGWL